MSSLKLLHLAFVVLWCGALLYLPLAVAASSVDRRLAQRRVLRLLYTGVATPAALVAIASGTLIFMMHGPLAPWLIGKLAVVAVLVLFHAGLGLLVQRSEKGEAPVRCVACALSFGAVVLGVSTTAWLVLAKPAP